MFNRFQNNSDNTVSDRLDGTIGGNFRSFLGGSTAHQATSGFSADPLALANASAEIRARQAALSAGPAQIHTPSYRNTPHHRSDHEANVSALREQIKQELAHLRGELTNSISKNAPPRIDGELAALRGELAQIRNMVASHGGAPQQDQWKKFTRSMDNLSAHPPAGKSDIALLREELAEMRAIVATSAREDSVRQLSNTYADLAQRVDRNTAAAKDDAARQALARLVAQAEATQIAVESLPSTRHLSNVEARIDGLSASLEKVLGNRAQLDSDMLSALEGRLAQIASTMSRMDANSQAMPDEQAVVLQRLEQRMANLADQLEARAPRNEEPMLAAMDTIGQRLDALAAHEPVAGHQVDLIAQRLDDISSRLDRANDAPGQSDALETILSQIGALQSKVDDASPRNMLPTLEQRLDSINSGLDRMATRPVEPDFSAIEAQMQHMAAQIDNLAPQLAPHDFSQDISSLEASVREMHNKLDTLPETGPFNEPTGNRLERQIAELASQLEHSAAPQPADPVRLAELEGQISNISQLLSETNQHAHAVSEAMGPALANANAHASGTDQAIAARFDALEANLNHQQSALLDAARQAAHEVASNQNGSNENSELLLKLADDLDRLHVTAAETSDGNRQTFSAVHTTLEKIVERLEQLEVGGTGAAPVVAQATAAPRELEMASDHSNNSLLDSFDETTPPPMPRAAPFASYEELPAVHAPGVESELPGGADVPLEPGQVPTLDAAGDSSPLPQAPLPQGSGNDGMDFIAAARRAARAAADEAAPTGDAPIPLAGDKPSKKAKKAKRATQKTDGDAKSSGSRLRRPIILASAAVLLALATMKLAPAITGMLSSEPEIASVAVEPSATAQSAADVAQTDAMQATDGTRIISMDPVTGADSAPTQSAQAQAPAMVDGGENVSAPIVAPQVQENVGSAALRQAAQSGNPAAMFEIALRYTEGRVVDKDSQVAFKWYQQAAEAGLAPAQFRLANFFEKGLGTEQDYDAAVMWYQRAVDAGNARAMHNLAVLHTEEAAGGQKVDEATRLFRDAAELGVRDSQFNLGIMYGRGLGVELDLAESYKWFALAARAGDAEAAEKRDQVANAMLPEDLDKARIAAQAWQAKPLIEQANTVNIPAEWSADSPGATANGANALMSPTGVSGETTGGIAIESGNVARDVQSALLALGYGIGTADGVIGPKTSSAIRDFERRMGMPETGAPSPALLQAMLSVSVGSNG